MIFNKDATFPYPVVNENIEDYIYNTFNLNVNIRDDINNYYFEYEIDLNSTFILDLIRNGKATVWLVFQSKDNLLFKLDDLQGKVSISKQRISLSERTAIQAHIQAVEGISFEENNDLVDFYNVFKSSLIVEKNNLLGYSNIIRFFGDMEKPLELFSKRLDENLNSEIKVELQEETIVIVYKKREYQFNGLTDPANLNNMYVYLGLNRALTAFIANYGQSGEVDLTELTYEDISSNLHIKLYNLMTSKNVDVLNEDNIDEVIYLMTDHLIDKYSKAIWRIDQHDGSTI